MEDRELKGEMCQCGGCGLYFNSEAAFNKHRVGGYDPPSERRCLTITEMRQIGMDTNSRDLWVTKLHDRLDKIV